LSGHQRDEESDEAKEKKWFHRFFLFREGNEEWGEEEAKREGERGR